MTNAYQCGACGLGFHSARGEIRVMSSVACARRSATPRPAPSGKPGGSAAHCRVGGREPLSRPTCGIAVGLSNGEAHRHRGHEPLAGEVQDFQDRGRRPERTTGPCAWPGRIAELDGADHLTAAIGYRRLDRKRWAL